MIRPIRYVIKFEKKGAIILEGISHSDSRCILMRFCKGNFIALSKLFLVIHIFANDPELVPLNRFEFDSNYRTYLLLAKRKMIPNKRFGSTILL